MSTSTTTASTTNSDAQLAQKYARLKRKYKALVHESMMMSDELTATKKRLMRVHQERSYLLDRLLAYEGEALQHTASTDVLGNTQQPSTKKRRVEEN